MTDLLALFHFAEVENRLRKDQPRRTTRRRLRWVGRRLLRKAIRSLAKKDPPNNVTNSNMRVQLPLSGSEKQEAIILCIKDERMVLSLSSRVERDGVSSGCLVVTGGRERNLSR
jgi:hypothetical protein